ncbi:Epoxide hydrolase A-like protein [Cladobotryum mycophilum]|uniref:Epoxide hydrolase A-like protein n=1 Tax=Cladobotryum mycophilum TaxID=491253 RepID=A0ABR0SRD9_9HYPO
MKGVLCMSMAFAALASAIAAPKPFNPNAYTKKFATCKATERGDGTPVDIKLKLAYLDINPTAEKVLVMLHGWPSLWTTYRNQILSLGQEYRLIIPEHRGYGDSEHPHDLFESNTMPDFVDDVMCMMDNAGVKAGVCVGNDFGAQVCWEAGRMRPDRFIGVFNIVVPYVSSAFPFAPTEKLVEIAPGFGYQLYLSNNASGGAIEMDADPRNGIRSCAQIATSEVPEHFLKDQTSFLQSWYEDNKKNGRKDIPFSGIMSQEVEDYMVASYQKQGFYNTFNGYQRRNRYDTYQFERAQGNYTLSQPTFSLYPTKDPVANWAMVASVLGSAKWLTNHYNATIDTAHWPHEETPDAFDAIFKEWIGNVTFAK